MPEEGPMLKVPAPWPWAFRVYRISRSAKDLAFTISRAGNVMYCQLRVLKLLTTVMILLDQ